MTPPRLTELQCPRCEGIVWVIDSDFRGIGPDTPPYDQRQYPCSHCRYRGPGWKVGQQSPPEFLLQPHNLYPMTQEAFDYWVRILRTHFPTHPALTRLGKDFVPRLPPDVEVMKALHERVHPVGEMRDQDGARRADPDLSTAIEWFEMMKPGQTLVLNRRDGGRLYISLDQSGHSARCLDASGKTLAETSALPEQVARDAVACYLNGNTSGCARTLRRSDLGFFARLWNHVVNPS
jgi:hypothetical protein